MEYTVKMMNPKTGESETTILAEKDCWQKINALYAKAIPDKKIKPVNLKIELNLGLDAEG